MTSKRGSNVKRHGVCCHVRELGALTPQKRCLTNAVLPVNGVCQTTAVTEAESVRRNPGGKHRKPCFSLTCRHHGDANNVTFE